MVDGRHLGRCTAHTIDQFFGFFLLDGRGYDSCIVQTVLLHRRTRNKRVTVRLPA